MLCFNFACIEKETYFLSCGFDFVEKNLVLLIVFSIKTISSANASSASFLRETTTSSLKSQSI